MAGNLIGDGVELMLFGMGTVIVFLSLLVVVTGTMSALVRRYLPAEPPPPVGDSHPDGALLAAISAAVHQHRASKKS